MEDDDGFDDFDGLEDLAALDDDSLLYEDIDVPPPTTNVRPPVTQTKTGVTPFSASTSRAVAPTPIRQNTFGAQLSFKNQNAKARPIPPPPPAKDYFSQFRNGGKGPISHSTTSSSSASAANPQTGFLKGSIPPKPINQVQPQPTTTQQDDFGDIGDLDNDWSDEDTQNAIAATDHRAGTGNSVGVQPLHAPAQAQTQAKLFPIFSRQSSSHSMTSNTTANRAPQASPNFLTRTNSGISSIGSTSGGSWVPVSDKSNDFTTPYFKSPERPPPSNAPARLTHHVTDQAAVLTWKYPNNYPKRDYQFNITRRALFTNTLVSLPTGLGKTFIAAVVMLNYYRWFPESKVIFMAPTRPLVSQQIEACFKICGIPQKDTIELTGQQNSDFRSQAWATKRVIFCTPQVLQNDLRSNNCPAREIVCLVVDEAHRATGNYAFSGVVRHLTPINPDIRILALTATPGSDIKTVQQVVTNLNIAAIELRTEDSMDLRQYVFQRVVQEIVVPLGKTLTEIRDEYKGMTKQYLEKLHKFGVIDTAELSQLTRFSVIRGRDFYLRNTGHSQETIQQVRRLSALCTGIIQAYELLTIHGIRPFFVNLADPAELARVGYLNHDTSSSAMDGVDDDGLNLDDDDDDGGFPARGRGRGRGRGGRGRGGRGGGRSGSFVNDGETSSLAKKTLQTLPAFGRLMNRLVVLQNQPNFIGHPKLERLVGIVVEHFVQHQDRNDSATSRSSLKGLDTESAEAEEDESEGSPQTRVMIFANYRESVEEITRVLNAHRPMIRVSSFIGQASAKGKKGISQKEQQKLVADFQKGHHNVLVATSIGEEGLDIGDVDLIICYDSHSSPIRMLQRMGRTGRKRKGKICLLLSEGQEEQKYRRSVTQYKNVQKAIANGSYLEFYRYSPRILPPGPYPQVEMVRIEAEPYEDPSTVKGPRKRRKLNDGAGESSSGAFNSSAFLDDEELARFQRKYLIPRRNIRSITFESASKSLVKRLSKKFDQQSIAWNALELSFEKRRATTQGLDPTSLVGHSSTTKAFVQSLWQLSTSRSELLMKSVGQPSRDEYGTRMMSRLSLDSEDDANTLHKKKSAPKRLNTKQRQRPDSRALPQLTLDLFCPVIDSSSESDQALAGGGENQKGKGKGKQAAADKGKASSYRSIGSRPPVHSIICSDDDDDDFEIMQGLDKVFGLESTQHHTSTHVGTSESAAAAPGYSCDDDDTTGCERAFSHRKRLLPSSQSKKRRLLVSSESDCDGETPDGIALERTYSSDEIEHDEQTSEGVSKRLVFDFASGNVRHGTSQRTAGQKDKILNTVIHTSTDELPKSLPEGWYKSDDEEGTVAKVKQEGGAANTTVRKPGDGNHFFSPKIMTLPPAPKGTAWYRSTVAISEMPTNGNRSSDGSKPSQSRPPRMDHRQVIHIDEEENNHSSSEEEKKDVIKNGDRGHGHTIPQPRRHKLQKNGSSRWSQRNDSYPDGIVLSTSGGNDFVEINDDDLAALMEDISDEFDY
ncbi:hypothetical protein BGW42_003317 [Actinomortierella wolfii]|nr:hypothetical protein BGW42_003317 [Actinomortierella wolfii]